MSGSLMNASITFEVANVEKNVVAVARLGDNGFETSFNKTGGFLRKVGGNLEVPFRRHGRRFLLAYEHGMKPGLKTYLCV
jgi:hypothetical protein